MSSARIHRALALASISTALVLALSAPQARAAETYRVRSLVSDGGVPAAHKDKNLVNGWGIAFGPRLPPGSPTTGPASRPSTTATATSTRWSSPSRRARPTGIVFNGTAGFVVAEGLEERPQPVHLRQRGRRRLGLVAERGPEQRHRGIHGQDGAIYKGLALVTAGQHSRLYATDFHNGKVDVLDERFRLVKAPGGFTDPGLPKRLRAVRHPERRRQALRHLRQAGRRPGGRRRRRRASASSTCSTRRDTC